MVDIILSKRQRDQLGLVRGVVYGFYSEDSPEHREKLRQAAIIREARRRERAV